MMRSEPLLRCLDVLDEGHAADLGDAFDAGADALKLTRREEGLCLLLVLASPPFDAAARLPWTSRYLRLIAANPGTVARELAPQVDSELLPFKRRVRQLKELGLT